MENKTLEVMPSNATVASSIGADNINYAAEVALVAIGKVGGKLAKLLGHTSTDIGRSTLIVRTLQVVRSKRGLGEKNVPNDVAEAIVKAVDTFIALQVKRVTDGDNVKVKGGYSYRLNDSTNPVQWKTTAVSTHTIGLQAQINVLGTKCNHLEAEADRADAASNHVRADKLRETFEKTSEARAWLGAKMMAMELALQEAAK